MTTDKLLCPKYYTDVEGGLIKLWTFGPVYESILKAGVNSKNFYSIYDPIINNVVVHALFIHNPKTKLLVRWDRINGKFTTCEYRFAKVRGKDMFKRVNLT